MKFTVFSFGWFEQVAQNPDVLPDQLHPNLDDVTDALCQIVVDAMDLGCSVELDVALQHTDLERYQAAHAKLMKEIWQDEQARKLWYTMDDDPRD